MNRWTWEPCWPLPVNSFIRNREARDFVGRCGGPAGFHSGTAPRAERGRAVPRTPRLLTVMRDHVARYRLSSSCP